MTQFGVGEPIALTVLTELGDVTRMSSSAKPFGSPASTSSYTAPIRPPASASSPAKVPPRCAGRSMGRPISHPAPEPRLRRLSRPESPRAYPHPRVTDDRAQDRPPQLPPAAQPRTRRPGTHPRLDLQLRSPPSTMTPSLQPVPSASLAPTPVETLTKTERLPSTRQDDPSTITSRPPRQVLDDPDKAGRPRSQPHTTHPIGGLDTNHLQISGSLMVRVRAGPEVRGVPSVFDPVWQIVISPILEAGCRGSARRPGLSGSGRPCMR